jgi:hypothetical protein
MFYLKTSVFDLEVLFWRNIQFFKLSHNRVRYGRYSVSCLWAKQDVLLNERELKICTAATTVLYVGSFHTT